jgi:hypothetical protein
MVHQTIKNTLKFFPVLLLIFGIQACYYDNTEELYPMEPDCDTTNVTFSGDVWPVINSNCIICHSGSAPQGNVSLENYQDIVTAANNGSLLGVIRHDDGWPEMPKGGGMLPECDITKIEIWVEEGTPNN